MVYGKYWVENEMMGLIRLVFGFFSSAYWCYDV